MHLRIAGVLFAATLSLGGAAVGQTPSSAPAATWATADGVTVLKDFRFGSGETLPELKLHYLSWARRIATRQGTWTTRCCCCMELAATRTRF
jgi:hypothetical protein